MNCNICGEPVILVPSAAERARMYGGHPASYYTKLFPTHSTCYIKKREAETLELMRRTRAPAP